MLRLKWRSTKSDLESAVKLETLKFMENVRSLLFVKLNLFVNLHHCTTEYLHLAPPIFLYAKVDSAGGR